MLQAQFEEYMDKNLKQHADPLEPKIDFEAFSEIYKISLMWNKILFSDQKRQFLNHRRALLSKGKLEEYGKLCAKMGEAEEKNL